MEKQKPGQNKAEDPSFLCIWIANFAQKLPYTHLPAFLFSSDRTLAVALLLSLVPKYFHNEAFVCFYFGAISGRAQGPLLALCSGLGLWFTLAPENNF